LPPFGTSDHCEVEFSVFVDVNDDNRTVNRKQYGWHNADYNGMAQFIINTNWHDVLNLTADSLCAAFSEILQSAIKFVTVQTVDVGKRTQTFKKWYPPGIKRAVAR
jgi:hypothetical protein